MQGWNDRPGRYLPGDFPGWHGLPGTASRCVSAENRYPSGVGGSSSRCPEVQETAYGGCSRERVVSDHAGRSGGFIRGINSVRKDVALATSFVLCATPLASPFPGYLCRRRKSGPAGAGRRQSQSSPSNARGQHDQDKICGKET